MFEFLQYSFGWYALLIAIIIGLSAAIISPFLVLNEQALIADGLAHVSFTGLAIGMLFVNEPLFVSIPFAIVLSILVKYLSQKRNINGDAALGIISTVSLAVGLIIIHKSSGFNRSIEGMLIGNMWTVNLSEIIMGIIILILIILFVTVFYRKLLLMTYDYKYAKFRGVKTTLLSYSLSVLTAILITIGVKTIGTLLISSFVIFPVIIGMQFKTSFKRTLVIGSISSIIAVFLGISVADQFDIPAGSTIVIVYAIILIVLMIIKRFIKGGGYRD
ncbi:metal ABC transporter permease [Haploplasma axanthum]|uniref:High-affinity zinc uptake system membrane protein znuB n=1 Tax=Haploplasma axanthum TaxID=29552 RepID=A0A449BDK0_HAPAX|nr:metal ABC transporter permease [Haploplasma axanthum]VEU80497.1 High-affinity zinc uptake system membrane protein znuB [Haploplasma axanthum]